MNFYTDRQTLEDLNIFGKRGVDSIYAIFNRTVTKGGAEQLDQLFRHPLADATAIKDRIEKIKFFQQHRISFFANTELFDSVALYLSNRDNRTKLRPEEAGLTQTIRAKINGDNDQQLIKRGIRAATELLQLLRKFLQEMEALSELNNPWFIEHQEMSKIIDQEQLSPLFEANAKKAGIETLAQLDQLIRFTHYEDVQKLLHLCYRTDVYIAVGHVAAARQFNFPEPVPEANNLLDVRELYHPQLTKPVTNSIVLNEAKNLLFLTGANMAGKSTFMKSLGVCLYLAHMGFPVPAASMRFSVREGMLTTINLADNLSMGFSHFYSEVMRVKKIATALQKGLKLFVLIDELFRGTNVKDAHDATIAVAEGFVRKSKSLYVISTHIMEAGEILQKRCPQISFQFLPTKMNGHDPVYTRKLETGISADRHGMIIIQNEGILQMLDECVAQPSYSKTVQV